MKSLRLTFNEHGKPNEVLRLEEHEVPSPSEGEVLLRMLASNINPSDLGTIGGSYGTLPSLPAVAGLEGVAEVEELGHCTSGLKVGDRVRIPSSAGSWQNLICTKATNLQSVPKEIPAEQAGSAFVNPPTALLLLRRIVDLNPGDWIVQNAANSAVGIAVIQVAKKLGIRTLNLVRREELTQPLINLGADVVMLDDDQAPKNFREYTEGKVPRLALNSVGGNSAYRLCKMVVRGGTHVTFGAMTSEATRFPTRFLIFNDIELKGFWLTRWMEETGTDSEELVMDEIFSMISEGTLKTYIEADYSLEEWKTALKHNTKPRMGKIIFKSSDP